MAELSAGAIVYTRYAMHHFTSNFRVEKVGMNFWEFLFVIYSFLFYYGPWSMGSLFRSSISVFILTLNSKFT